ncbi:HEAT repeat-containing protein 1, partial [Haplosporangium bisporale]
MSSLAQQLKKIGTADVTKGSEKAARHRSSFLFDSKQAADYDIDTIFSIGANGISELKQLDPKFGAFEKTLFSESMKNVDRVLQSKEDNAKLDESITLFLRQLSPYFLVKPAGKALEWLIRRFRINEFNIDAILHAILPYHETALFVTMVSILQIQESSRWMFLRPIRKSKQPLERSLLIQYMLKDRSLVEFVCETVLEAVSRQTSFKTLVSFYVAVMLQYIASLPVITDEVLVTIFPYILEGLKAKGYPEYQIASYMIISQISERATLTYEVLTSLFTTMSSNYANTYQMLLCVVHVCQTQETMEEFPEKAFKNLSRIQGIETVVLSILEKYSAQRFIYPFLVALAKHSAKHPNYARVLNVVLKGEQLPTSVINGVCSAVLGLYLSELKQDDKAEANEDTVSILRVLHENYSKDLDAVLQKQLEETKEDQHSQTNNQLYSFISKVFHGTRHQPLKEFNTTLFLSVNHADASVRLLAVKKLGEILKEKSSELANVDNEDTFVKDTLLARLQDDDDRIVQQVLGMDKLKDFVSAQDLLAGLVTVITSTSSTRGTRRHCLVYMLTDFLASNKDLKDHVLAVVLGHLLIALKSHTSSAKALKAEAKHGMPAAELLSQITTKSWVPSMEVSAIHFSLMSVISDLHKPKTTTHWLSNEESSDYATILVSLYKTFVGTVNMGPFEPMVQIMFETHLPTDSIEFLCNQWSDVSSSPLVRVRSLQIASANLHAFAAQSSSDAPDFQVVVPTLMLALANPVKAMRETAVVCLSTIASIYPKVKTSGKKGKTMATDIFKFDSFYGKATEQLEFLMPEQISIFVSQLLKSREEFVTDSSYLTKYLSENLNAAAGDSKVATSAKDSLVSFLLSHTLAIQRPSTRVELLQLLDDIHTPTKLKMLLPLIDSLVHTTFVGQTMDDINTDLARYLVHCFSPETSALLEGKSGKYRNAFLQLLKLDSSASTNTDTEESSSSFRRLALGQLNVKFFGGLSASLQSDIFVVLIDLATNAPQETVRVVKQVLRDIPLSSILVISELATIQMSLVQGTMVDEEGHAKRQRKSAADPSAPNAVVESLHRLVTVLELLEYKEIAETDKLVVPLFELLSTIMNSDLNSTPVSMEYINQLLLSSLTTFVRQGEFGVNAGKLDENMLRVDLVVNCIRATGNPQTHNQALLLMAAIASLYPEKVLHNIMPVFTFMGANVLRQDDNYSFHVIQQTLEKIIPPLVNAHRRQSDETKSLVMQVRPIIKVFVDALFHIPKHRRLRLFSVLISTLGEEEFLHAVICLIIEKYTERASKGNQTEADSLSEFALTLSNQFSAIVQMKAVIALLDVIQTLPMEKDADVEMEEYLFDI